MVSRSPRAVVSTLWISAPIGVAISAGQISRRMLATSSARFFEPRKPASAVTRIRNGNSDISADSAI